MISEPDQYEVLVVGAGQSGLAIGYYLKRLGIDFVLFDAAPDIRHVWPIPAIERSTDSRTARGPRFLYRCSGGKRVVGLVEEVRGSQSNMSGHLSCLKACGFVKDGPHRRQTFYAVGSKEVVAVLHAAEKLLDVNRDGIELCPEYGARRR